MGAVAPFTVFALVANIALYALSAMRSGPNLVSINGDVLIALGGSMRERLWEGEWIRLVAPMFLHGGLLHILFNMSFLWRAGPDAEAFFGTPNFGTIYLLSGVTGICFSQIFGGHLSIGASTSLCGIMGAHLAVLIVNSPVPRHAWRSQIVRAEAFNLAFLLGIGILGFFRMDNWGHFGGMVAGLLLGGSFELWRRRSAAGKIGLFATLVFIGALICAARWSVFNPLYHVYQVAYATEELKDPNVADEHAAEAREWARRWNSISFLGISNAAQVDAILAAYQLRFWTLDNVRNGSVLRLKGLRRRGTDD